MAKLPHMPLYVFDLESDRDCRAMSDADFGRYIRLLIRQWIEGDVPADLQSAIRDAMLDPEAEDSLQSLMDRKFPRTDGGRRANPRLAQIRSGVMAKVEKWRENGAKGGRPPDDQNQLDNQGVNQKKTKRQSIASGSGSDSGSGAQGGSAEGGASKPGKGQQRTGAAEDDVGAMISGTPPPIPPELDTPQFREAWASWVRHRHQSKNKLTAQAAENAIRKLEKWGHDRAIAAIEHSVANGWRGVFEPEGAGDGRANSAAATGGTGRRGRDPDANRGEFAEDLKL